MMKKKPIIVAITAGHGETTYGKRSPDGKLLEWEFNRVVARELTIELRHAVNTNPGPIAIPIWDRQNYIHWLGATNRVIHISIHANAAGKSGWNRAKGAVIIHRKKASAGSIRLAQLMHDEMASLDIGTRFKKPVARNIKNIATGKLKNGKPMRPRLASILVECGFMTNKRDCGLLLDTEYRGAIARAQANAIKAFIEEVEK